MSYTDRASYWASKYGVDPGLFSAVVKQESGWNPYAVNQSSGAFGLTQAMPATARDPGFGVAPLTDTDNPDEQLRFGAQYLGSMLNRYGGDKEKALAAYNWGPGHADRWSGDVSQLPNETADYIAKILDRNTGTPLSDQETAQAPVEPEAPPEPDYGEGLLGDAQRWRDTRRDELKTQLGLGDRGSEMLGSVLASLGNQMIMGY